MIASLPMYDRPETAAANDALWALIRDDLRGAGIDAPDILTRGPDLWAEWEAPDLLLSQTCGLPYRARLKGKVTIIGAPDYGLEDCPPGYYASKIVVRAEDDDTDPSAWKAKTLAFNETRSQSGWAAALNHAEKLGTGFARSIETGAHLHSVQAIAESRADIAVIDAQSWRIISRWEPAAKALKIIGQTDPTPATPFITAIGQPDDVKTALRGALERAIAALPEDARALIDLQGMAQVPEEAYMAVPTPAR